MLQFFIEVMSKSQPQFASGLSQDGGFSLRGKVYVNVHLAGLYYS